MKNGNEKHFRVTKHEEPPLFTKDEISNLIKSASSIKSIRKKKRRYWHIAAAFFLIAIVSLISQRFQRQRHFGEANQSGNYEVKYASLIQDILNNPTLTTTGLVIPDTSGTFPVHIFARIRPPSNILREIGITFSKNRVLYEGNVKSAGYLSFSITGTAETVSLSQQPHRELREYDTYPLFLTDKDGRQILKFRFGEEAEDKWTTSFFERTSSYLVPVVLDVPGSQREIIFWFRQTNSLLELLRSNLPSTEEVIFNPPKREIKIYPNPAVDLLSLEIELLNEELKVELLDINGRMVKTLIASQNMYSGVRTFRFDVADIQEGIYLLSIISNNAPALVQRIFIAKK